MKLDSCDIIAAIWQKSLKDNKANVFLKCFQEELRFKTDREEPVPGSYRTVQ